MEVAKKITEHERETLEIVLKEILEEQQKTSKINLNQAAATAELAIKVDSFNERLENFKIIAPPVSSKPYEDILKNFMLDLQLRQNNGPKIITRKFQILLFPEHDAKLFYKIVFGRWLLLLALMLLINRVYDWAIHKTDINKQLQLKEMENERLKKTMNYLPTKPKKSSKKYVDSDISNDNNRP